MIRWVFFVIFIFSFSNSWGKPTIEELWTETGYSFDILFKELNAQRCYQSEKKFSGCLMAFHKLLASAIKDNFYQLRVSGLNNLEIVPYPKEEYPKTIEEAVESEKKRRTSFRLFFQTVLKPNKPST